MIQVTLDTQRKKVYVADGDGLVSTPGDAFEVLDRDRQEWKRRALRAEAECRIACRSVNDLRNALMAANTKMGTYGDKLRRRIEELKNHILLLKFPRSQ